MIIYTWPPTLPLTHICWCPPVQFASNSELLRGSPWKQEHNEGSPVLPSHMPMVARGTEPVPTT